MTYKNLRNEMSRRKIKGYELARVLGIKQSTFSLKLNGRSEWTLEQMLKIKSYIGTAMPLELLFKIEGG